MYTTMYSKKIVSLMAVGILGLTACGDDGSSGDDGASEFPSETIDMLVTFAAGGSNDAVVRLLTQHLEDNNENYEFRIENIEGGGGAVGQTQGSQADPDGHTLTMLTPSVIINPLLNDVGFTYDDFEPIAVVNNDAHILFISDDAPYDDVEGMIEYAEENPGDVTIGTSGVSASTGFTTTLFGQAAGVDITQVPHDGTADALLQAQGGHIHAAIAGGLNEAQSALESGEVEPALVFSEDRMDDLEEVPTSSEIGVDVIGTSWRGIAAPAGTDPEIVDELASMFEEVLETDEFIEAMEDAQLQVEYRGPEDFMDLINSTATDYEEAAE